MADPVLDPRTFPAVSADIGAQQHQPEFRAPRTAPPDHIQVQLDRLARRLEIVESVLSDHLEARQ